MDNGIYIALSRQMALFRDMEITANNIANMDTAGYKAEKLMFDDFLVRDSESPKMAFTNDVSSYKDTRNGPMKSTGNPMDMAISGDGYFTVDTPLGIRYTRAGNFQIDAQGMMVTNEGNAVLDDGGQPIIFGPEDNEVTVGEAGNIIVDGEERAFLGIVEFENQQMLERLNSTLYKSDGIPQPAANSRVLHGVVEASNVQPVLELTRMIQVSRSTSGTAKLIEAQYELERKASNTWAKQQ